MLVFILSKMDIETGKLGHRRRIGILPIEGFAILAYASLADPMRAANLLAGQTLYEVVNISEGAAVQQSSGAAVVTPQARVGDDLELDYLFVVAGGDPTAYDNKAVTAWLARMARKGVVLGGVSGGPIILAQAGLMGGRRMTVHWEHAEALAEISPYLLLERTLYVIDRDRLTCAGGTAPMDLMHALITQHHGPGFARRVSDWFMHTEIRPSAGPQRAGLVERVGSNNPGILDAVEVMEANIAAPVALGRLAEGAGLSPRQLNRLFQDHLGRSCMRYYRELRLDKAQNLLRNSPLSLTEIALATGFASSSHFSKVYSAQFEQPPSAYR
ncbi:HTH-type transcriptional regulator CdhR [Roseovarius albus]|uniref:HTH-type transcriptional regulator CdhR n=2 Tax=Roseovarius albus TaxID=1247867 RepID=A0A1X6ZNT6_9RHOB|nr:HTH-type transcriptional regulator CdhR [Roseovarius albus]